MAKMSFLNFAFGQLKPVPPVETADLTGKTVMVIGANTGIGYEATKHFVLMKAARVILACRNKEKGEAAVERIKNETRLYHSDVELKLVDLSSFASVIAFVDEVEKEGGRLDIVVANAGMAAGSYRPTSDGYESTLQVNCLSLFLVAFRLLPLMMKTAKDFATHPRFVLVSSEVHFWAKIPSKVLHEADTYKVMSSKEYFDKYGTERYPESKLFDILFHRALSSHLGPNSPIIVNGVNPGFCHSELAREVSGIQAIMMWTMKVFLARTPEQGARQLVYAALGGQTGDGEVEEKLRGAYVSTANVEEPSDFVIGEEGKVVQEKLWKEVVEILEKVDPRVEAIVKEYCVA
ncbi:hypothetical protein H0H93_003570 [Arthromyces matolae]|nr:hypothetical protein H0H93_003570 [Arthromyces matolae]